MSLKTLLFLAPFAVGGWYLTSQASAPAGARLSRAECETLQKRLADELYAGPMMDGPAATRRMRAIAMELRGHGCEPGLGEPIYIDRMVRHESTRDPFEDSSRLRLANPPDPDAPTQATSFEPGRPVVDVSRGRNR